MKRVRDIINLREDESPSFTDADGDTGPYANNQDGKVTGGGRVQNYPVSASNISWIKTQGGPFAFGYLSGHTLENLTLELLGSDLSASVIKDADAKYDALTARESAELAAWAAAGYPDSLFAIVMATSAERSALLNRTGAYIIGGTINNPDPYELDYPQISSAREYKRKKKKELEKNSETLPPPQTKIEKFADENGLPRDYVDKLSAVNRYFYDNLKWLPQRVEGTAEKMDNLMKKAYQRQGFTQDQIDTVERKRLRPRMGSVTFKDDKPAPKSSSTNQWDDPDKYRNKVNVDPKTFQKLYNQKFGNKSQSSSQSTSRSNRSNSSNSFSDIRVANTRNTNTSSGGKNYGNIAANQGPSTPVKPAIDGRLVPNRGAGRAGEVRMKNPGMGLPPIKQVDAGGDGTLIAGTRNSSGRSNIPASESPRGPATPIKNYGTDANPKFMPSGPVVDPWSPKLVNNKNKRKTQVAHYEPEGEVLSENRKRIFRDLKKPVEVPELPKKYKMNFAGKYSSQNTPDKTSSQISDALVASGNAKGQRWKQKDKEWQGYETTERMNVVYDKVGHGDQYWNNLVDGNSRKKKDRELQEKLNIIAHEKALVQENPNYKTPFNQSLDEQETLSVDNDPLFKKVSKRMKKEIDYPDKPSKNGYPNDPPPEMINGYHPDLVNGQKVSNYYNRLDPASAEAMPKTGNDSIDKKVRTAAKKPK